MALCKRPVPNSRQSSCYGGLGSQFGQTPPKRRNGAGVTPSGGARFPRRGDQGHRGSTVGLSANGYWLIPGTRCVTMTSLRHDHKKKTGKVLQCALVTLCDPHVV